MADDKDLDLGNDFTPTDEKADDVKAALELAELEKQKALDAKDDKKDDEGVKLDAEDPDKKVDEDDPDKTKDDLKAKERSKVIPRERFDKAQEKAKQREEALITKIAELEKTANVRTTSADVAKFKKDMDVLQDKYEELIFDGKRAEAKEVRVQLSRMNETLVDIKSETYASAAKREAIDELKYDAALARAEQDHPAINPDSDEFDKDITDEVGVLLESFVLRGFTRDVALSKAVKYVVGPAKTAVREEETKVAKDQRAEEARKKAALADKKQPASLNKVEGTKDKDPKNTADIDIMRLSKNQFDKLDDDALSKLRGDSI